MNRIFVTAAAFLLGQGFVLALSLEDFRFCIGASGATRFGNTCTLDQGVYDITNSASAFVVARSGVAVEGAIITSPRDTTIRRFASSFQDRYSLMQLARDVQQVTIRKLFFDGNRAQQLGGGTPYKRINEVDGLVELDISSSSNITLSFLEFDNSPWISVNNGFRT